VIALESVRVSRRINSAVYLRKKKKTNGRRRAASLSVPLRCDYQHKKNERLCGQHGGVIDWPSPRLKRYIESRERERERESVLEDADRDDEEDAWPVRYCS
jgi:hypothetical protein